MLGTHVEMADARKWVYTIIKNNKNKKMRLDVMVSCG